MKRWRPDAPVAAVEALVLRGDRVLLVQRLAEPHRGKWCPPGGAVDLGETARAAVAREVREETGLKIEPGEVLDVIDVLVPEHGRPDYHYLLAVFRARAKGGRLRARSDAGDVRWVPFRELPRMDLTDATRGLIAKARKR